MANMKSFNNTARLFVNINKIGYLCGLPNMWIDGVDFPESLQKLCTIYRLVMIVVICLLVCLEWAAFYTQKNLNEKQSGDLLLFGISHPILFVWLAVVEFQKNRVQSLLHRVAVVLKEVHNDEKVEREMVLKVKKSGAGFSALFMMSLIFYGYDGITQVVRGEGTFTTLITFWPDVREISWKADLARVVTYLLWWVFMTRVCVVYVIIIATLVSLSHQFKNLQSYFYSLDGIFQEENLDQTQKEEKYEAAFKVGVQMHSQTLWCTRECQSAYNVLFSFQVVTVVAVLVMLMSQMLNSERTLENVLSIVTTGITMLFSTGFIMWNAGDVTVEAAALATAMYSSGWQHCARSARRVRRLMIITMTQSQQPVVIWALGIVELSYRSYVSIVKSSYSVFSVIF